MVDYLRHAVIIKRDHPEAAAAAGERSIGTCCVSLLLTSHCTPMAWPYHPWLAQRALLSGTCAALLSCDPRMRLLCAEANGKNEHPQRKHEAQLTILPLQHSKVGPTACPARRSCMLHRLGCQPTSCHVQAWSAHG